MVNIKENIMIVCSKCGKENQDNHKYCGYCGTILNGKVTCNHCQNEIPADCIYCPHCGRKVDSERENLNDVNSSDYPQVTNEKISNLKTNINIPIVTNMLVLIISFLSIILMFGNVSSVVFNTNKIDNNIFDYCEASINGFKKYTLEDLIDQYDYDANPDDFDKMNLSFFMIDDARYKFESKSVIIQLSTLVMLAMIILPIILIYLTINDMNKKKEKERYKSFFLINVILSLSLIALISLLAFTPSFVLIFYVIISLIPLIYAYAIKANMGKIKFDKNKFITLLLIALTFIVAQNRVLYFKDTFSRYTERIDFGSFTSVVDYLYQRQAGSSFLILGTPFINVFVGNKMQDANVWIIYFSLLIPLFIVTGLGFLLTGLYNEIKDQLQMHDDEDSATRTYLWISSAFFILAIVAIFVVNAVCNYFFTELYNDYKIGIEANTYFIVVISLTLAIYRTIVHKKSYKLY